MQLHIPVSLFCKLKILYYISREDTVVGPAFHLYNKNINYYIKNNFFQRIVLLILAIANYIDFIIHALLACSRHSDGGVQHKVRKQVNSLLK